MNLATWPTLRKIAAFGLLAVVLASINFRSFKPGQILGSSLNLNRARAFDCLNAAIPADVDSLFVVNPTHPPSYNTLATFYRAQYFLAPRLISLADAAKLEAEMAPYGWLIETSTQGQPLEGINAKLQLSMVKDCGDFYVLAKKTQP